MPPPWSGPGMSWWARVHDRGTAEGWPPALGRAALPGGEPPHILAFAPGAGRAMGMAAGPGAPNPPANPHPQVRLNLPLEEPSVSGIGPCWVRSRPESRGQQRPGAAQDVGCNRRSFHLQLPDPRRGTGEVEFESPHPVAASPPGSCLRGAESPRTGLTDSRWVTQQARNLLLVLEERGRRVRFLLGGSGGSAWGARSRSSGSADM